MKNSRQFRKSNNSTPIIYIVFFLAILLVVRWVIAPLSFSATNLLETVRQASPLGIVAIGQTIALLIGGIDLSVSSVITLTNIVAAKMMDGKDENILPTILTTVGIAILVGLINGSFIAFIQVPPIIATLAMSIILQGAYYIYTKGSPVGNISPGFRFIAEGHLLGIPWAMIFWLTLLILSLILLMKTPLGRRLYATGGNYKSAFISGIPTHKIIVLAYILSSVFACLAGLMLSAYIGVASTSVGDGYDLSSIAATVIGGTTFIGGQGNLVGTAIGALILTVINGLLTIININDAGKLIVQGSIIILMMASQAKKRG